MPNRDIHRPVAMVAGGGYHVRARRHYANQPGTTAAVVAETIGGIAGGWVGGAAPDWIDPPTSPRHRHVGHGVATVVGAVAWSADALSGLHDRLRRQADELAAKRHTLANDAMKALSLAAEVFLRFVVGLINGVIGGYVSHLALDALTPNGLPLFARGF